MLDRVLIGDSPSCKFPCYPFPRKAILGLVLAATRGMVMTQSPLVNHGDCVSKSTVYGRRAGEEFPAEREGQGGGAVTVFAELGAGEGPCTRPCGRACPSAPFCSVPMTPSRHPTPFRDDLDRLSSLYVFISSSSTRRALPAAPAAALRSMLCSRWAWCCPVISLHLRVPPRAAERDRCEPHGERYDVLGGGPNAVEPGPNRKRTTTEGRLLSP